MFWVVPVLLHNPWMNFDANLGSLSLMNLWGSPNLGNMCRTISPAVSSMFIPYPFYLFQPMCVDPWFEEVFILPIYRVLWFHLFLRHYSTHRGRFLGVYGPNKYSLR